MVDDDVICNGFLLRSHVLIVETDEFGLFLLPHVLSDDLDHFCFLLYLLFFLGSLYGGARSHTLKVLSVFLLFLCKEIGLGFLLQSQPTFFIERL